VANRAALYKRLVAAYRKAPGVHSVAAAEAGTTKDTARRAWERGWNDKTEPLQSIKTLFMDEQLQVRAALYDGVPAHLEAVHAKAEALFKEAVEAQEEAQRKAAAKLAKAVESADEVTAKAIAAAEERLKAAEAEAEDMVKQAIARGASEGERRAKEKTAEVLKKAKFDSVQQIAEKVQLEAMSRGTVKAAASLSALVIQHAPTFAQMANKVIMEKGFKDPEEALRCMTMMVKMVELSERTILINLQQQNLNAGKPTEILGIQGQEELSLDDYEARIRIAAKVIERKRLREGIPNVVNSAATSTTGPADSAGPGPSPAATSGTDGSRS